MSTICWGIIEICQKCGNCHIEPRQSLENCGRKFVKIKRILNNDLQKLNKFSTPLFSLSKSDIAQICKLFIQFCKDTERDKSHKWLKHFPILRSDQGCGFSPRNSWLSRKVLKSVVEVCTLSQNRRECYMEPIPLSLGQQLLLLLIMSVYHGLSSLLRLPTFSWQVFGVPCMILVIERHTHCDS